MFRSLLFRELCQWQQNYIGGSKHGILSIEKAWKGEENTCISLKFRPERCSVYLRLLWIGNTSIQLLEQIKRSINRCFNSIKLQVILKSNVLFSPNIKDNVTVFLKSSLIFKFSCKGDVCYIGHTTQRLDISIKQHIPSNIHTNTSGYTVVPSNQNSSSSIARNQLDNPDCAAAYKLMMFTILANLNNEFYFTILEA